jgi:hypothetical protein
MKHIDLTLAVFPAQKKENQKHGLDNPQKNKYRRQIKPVISLSPLFLWNAEITQISF